MLSSLLFIIYDSSLDHFIWAMVVHPVSTESTLLFLSSHGPVIRTRIKWKKIPCYMRYSAWRWLIVKKLKYFKFILNIFEFYQLYEIVESWLVYANKFSWIAQLHFSTGIIKRSQCQLLFLAFKIFYEKIKFSLKIVTVLNIKISLHRIETS